MQQGNLAIRSSAGGEGYRESKRGAGEGGKKKTRETGKQEACGSRKKGAARETVKKVGCNTRTSQEVTHPSTSLAQARLAAEF